MKLILKALVLVLAIKGWQRLGQLEFERKVDNSLYRYEFYLDTMGVAFPKVAICQNVLETGTFSSKVYRENHNPFGMKESSRLFDIGTKNGHANYPHTKHEGSCTISCYRPAIKDYAAWQKVFKVEQNCKSDEEYIEYLQHLPGGRQYAEDPQYCKKLLKIYHTIWQQ